MLHLKKRVALVGCSDGRDWHDKPAIDALCAELEKMGLEAVISPALYCAAGGVTQLPQERAAALMQAFRDDSISAILDVSGGDSANAVLPFLDFPAGTSRVDIRSWIDERHSKGVAYFISTEDASNAASITSLLHCQKLCTECCSETCVFNPQGICMAPFLTGKKPGIHDDGCTDYCPKPLDGCELVRSYSEHELRSYEEDVREYISQFTDEELMEVYELDRTTLNALAPRAAVLMRKYIDNDDSWTYHRDYAISEVVSEY